MALPYNQMAAIAQKLRGWQAEHPIVDTALGFVPGVGSVLGGAEAAAAYNDPEAGLGERALATAGAIPGVKPLEAIVGGGLGLARIAKKFPGKKPRLWFGEDAAPRFEIPDVGAKLRELPAPGNPKRLEDVLQHDLLYDAYPQMRDVRVVASQDMPASELGKLTGTGNTPVVQMNASRVARPPTAIRDDELLQTLLHEGQHGVQNLERRGPGFAGTNVKAAGGWAPYLNDVGEMEARLTQYRRGWTPHQTQIIPFDTHQWAEAQRLREAEGIGKFLDPAKADVLLNYNRLQDVQDYEKLLNYLDELESFGLKP